jgi:hypothetical protein
MEVNQTCVPESVVNSGLKSSSGSLSLQTEPPSDNHHTLEGTAEQAADKVDPRVMFLRWSNPQTGLASAGFSKSGVP